MSGPRAGFETGTETYRARLTPSDEAERARRLEQQAEIMPPFGDYMITAEPRLVPVFRIDRL